MNDGNQTLDDFERALGRTLPKQYRNFLIDESRSYDGLFHYHEDEALDFAVSELFRLDGERRLQDNYKPWEFFDLDDWRRELSQYLCVGDTVTGDLILLDLNAGGVHILLADLADGDRPEIRLVSAGFDDFASRLTTQEHHPTPPGFEDRLAEMEAQRQQYVREYLESQKKK